MQSIVSSCMMQSETKHEGIYIMAINISSIKKGKNIRPPRIFLYGTNGIGKSTFGSEAPNPIFICVEDGAEEIGVARFPDIVKTKEQLFEYISFLYNEKHDFNTVVLDSADWLEDVLINEISNKYTEKELSYGKGSMYLNNEWLEVLQAFDALRNDKGMIVILIGHSEVKRYDAPECDSYDRYQPKLNHKTSGLIREWCDCFLFFNYKTFVKKEDIGFNKEKSRGITNGQRFLFTTESPTHLAKNRYRLPESIECKEGVMWEALSANISKFASEAK
jgi:hypothetical protein